MEAVTSYPPLTITAKSPLRGSPRPPSATGLWRAGVLGPRRAHSWQGRGQGPSELQVLALEGTPDSLGQGPESEKESPEAEEADCDPEKGCVYSKGVGAADANLVVCFWEDPVTSYLLRVLT